MAAGYPNMLMNVRNKQLKHIRELAKFGITTCNNCIFYICKLTVEMVIAREYHGFEFTGNSRSNGGGRTQARGEKAHC